MGWASGSALACETWEMVRKYVPEKQRKTVARKLYDRFCDEDADDWDGDSQLEKDADVNQEDTCKCGHVEAVHEGYGDTSFRCRICDCPDFDAAMEDTQ